MLVEPAHLEGFHILRVDLGKAYGEGESLRATPYVKHMKLGGMCAQAACQMAVLLLIDHARGVHGVAEIAAIASEHQAQVDEADGLELDLGGMTPEGIVSYIRDPRVGLHANIEIPTLDLGHPGLDTEARLTAVLAEAMRGYIQSGYPVIVPVDSGRLQDLTDMTSRRVSAIVETQFRDVPEYWRAVRPRMRRNHAVVAVGCNSIAFVLNDPGILPFLEASPEQISASRVYAENTASYVADFLGGLTIITVVPGKVRLPLLPTRNPDANGLMVLADHVGRERLPGFPFWHPGCIVTHEYRLLEVRGGRPVCSTNVAPLGTSPNDQPLQVVDEAMKYLGHLSDGWYWLQLTNATYIPGKTESSLWIWDATKDPPSIGTVIESELIAREYLVAVARLSAAGKWSAVPHHPQARGPLAVVPIGTSATFDSNSSKAALAPSLVSSVCAHGINSYATFAEMAPWKDRVGCELYTFMQTDLRVLFGREARNSTNVVDFLSGLSEANLPEMVRRINGILPDHCHLTGFASFVPEITSARKDKRDQAVSALINLFRLALALNAPNPSQISRHSIQTIEAVCGSRISEVYPANRQDRSGVTRMRFFAERRSDHQAIRLLLDSLQRVKNVVKSLTIPGVSHPKFVLELEPGPMFSCRSQATLQQLCSELRGSHLDDLFRINVDTSHFLIAGIDFSSLPDSVRELCYHVHLSENHRAAHFGDVRLGDCISVDRHQEMIAEIRKAFAKRSPDSYSGGISLEYEAAKRFSFVVNSMNNMLTLLN